MKVLYVQILLPSVRNSESGNLSLLHELKITKFFCSDDFLPRIKDLRAQKPDVQIYTVPLIEQMAEAQADHYPYEKTFEEAQNDPIILCHTSGSTGKSPKRSRASISDRQSRCSKANRAHELVLCRLR